MCLTLAAIPAGAAFSVDIGTIVTLAGIGLPFGADMSLPHPADDIPAYGTGRLY